MAIKKQAAIQKKASAFNTYRIPLGANGQPLQRNEHGEYVGPSGEPYDPETDGMIRTLKRSVLTDKDLMDVQNFPLQGKTLNLKKYKAIIEELHSAVNNAKSGIVNFVIGEETEQAEAVLKAAFPPGSGIAYKGVDGYEIHAPNWGNLGESREKLIGLIRGNPRGIDRQTLDYYRRLSDEIASRPAESGKARPATPIEVLTPPVAADRRDVAAPAPVPIGPGARPRPAAPGAPGAPGARPETREDWILNQIDSLNASIKWAQTKMRSIEDRYNREKDAGDPDGLPQSKRHEDLLRHVDRCQRLIKRRQSELPQAEDFTGEIEYDGTGFLDIGDAKKIYGQLLALLDPQKVMEFNSVDSGNSPSAGRSMDEPGIKRVYDLHKAEMVEMVKSFQRNATPEITQACTAILGIIEKPYEEIRAARGALEKAINMLCTKLASQNKLLIINDLQESSLVEQMDDNPNVLRFLADEVITSHFGPKQLRQKKAIILVSRLPIRFGFGGVIQVPEKPGAFLVDDDEGEALVRFCIDRCRKVVKRKIDEAQKMIRAGKKIPPELMPSASLIDVSNADIQRLSQIINGKSQVEAYGFLTRVFGSVIDKKTGALSGRALVKEGNKRNNENIRNGTNWTTSGGQIKGMYRKEAKLTMENYIHSKRTDWGTVVDNIQDTASIVRSKSARQKQLLDKEHAIRSGQSQGADIGSELGPIRSEIMRIDRAIKAHLHTGIKHFMILYGAAGCGKSAFPEALANLLDYDLFDVDFSQSRGSLVGQTETWSKALLDSWLKLSNVVIRLDEMDGQVVSEEAEGRESYNAAVMSQLLSFFQDNEHVLQERNIFVVATTNHLERIRKALADRAEHHYVPRPFDQEGYQEFLERAIPIMRRDHPMGLVYDPEATTMSSDLWPETEAFWNNLKPEFPRMAQSLTNSGMNFRNLCDFIVRMFSCHRNYAETSMMLRLYNDNRAEFIKQYSDYCQRDERTGAVTCTKPKVRGFAFTADNFCRAATLTCGLDKEGNRVDDVMNRGDEITRIRSGIEALGREMYGNGSERPGATTSPQQEFDLFGNEGADDDLMPAAGTETVASTDYYYQQLVKAGFAAQTAKAAQAVLEKAKTAQAAPQVRETDKEMLARIKMGDIRPSDVIEDGMFGVYPVPNMRGSSNVKG